LGRDLCRSFVGVQVVASCEDPAFRVRKATASNFAEVARVVGDEYLLKRLMPAYGKLVHDYHWGVRKAAAEGLIGVVMALDVDSREEPLVPLVNALLKDTSRWVRMSALQQLGYFIAALEKPERVPASLFTQYVEIIEQTKANPDAADISFHCAYTYAAVTKTMGKSCWPTLQAPFLSLCKDPQMKTRKAMAASMHIVAQTVSHETLEQEVLPQFETLLLDSAHEVRHAALRNVGHMLRAAPRLASKQRMLKALQGAMGNKPESWRIRCLVASQLGGICEALANGADAVSGGSTSSAAKPKNDDSPASAEADASPSAASRDESGAEAVDAASDAEDREAARGLVWSVVVPLFLHLCNDPVCEVRDEASRATARALRGASPELLMDPIPSEGSSGSAVRPSVPPAALRLLKELKYTFARGRSFRARMCFVRMCDSIIREAPLHVFQEYLLKQLVRTSRDRVKNVRVLWVNSMLPHIRKAGRLGQCELLVGAAKRMAADDKDEEVKRLLAVVPLADIGTEAADAVLAAESDLDDSDKETILAEGGTGNSSEVDIGEQPEVIDTSAAVSSSSAPAPGKSAEGDSVSTEQATASSSSTTAAKPPFPSGSGGFNPPTRTVSGETGFSSSEASAAGAGAAHAFFDPVEDLLVEQKEVQREIEGFFPDSRLFLEEKEALTADDKEHPDELTALPPRSPSSPSSAPAAPLSDPTPTVLEEPAPAQASEEPPGQTPAASVAEAADTVAPAAVTAEQQSSTTPAELAEAPTQVAESASESASVDASKPEPTVVEEAVKTSDAAKEDAIDDGLSDLSDLT